MRAIPALLAIPLTCALFAAAPAQARDHGGFGRGFERGERFEHGGRFERDERFEGRREEFFEHRRFFHPFFRPFFGFGYPAYSYYPYPYPYPYYAYPPPALYPPAPIVVYP